MTTISTYSNSDNTSTVMIQS